MSSSTLLSVATSLRVTARAYASPRVCFRNGNPAELSGARLLGAARHASLPGLGIAMRARLHLQLLSMRTLPAPTSG